MLSKSQQTILQAFYVVMKPMVRMIFRTGMGYSEFCEATKAAFVDVATEDFGVRGRPTNVSRVAAMTGLTRKEVKKIRERRGEGVDTYIDKPIPPSMVVAEWQSNPCFLEQDGSPRILSFDGDGDTFSSLVRTIGTDVPPGAMRAELKRMGCVSETVDRKLKLVRTSFFNEDVTERLATCLRNHLRTHVETIAHNTAEENQDDLRLERLVFSMKMGADDIPKFRRLATNRLKDTIASVADVVNTYESMTYSSQSGGDSDHKAVGVGVFYFEED